MKSTVTENCMLHIKHKAVITPELADSGVSIYDYPNNAKAGTKIKEIFKFLWSKG